MKTCDRCLTFFKPWEGNRILFNVYRIGDIKYLCDHCAEKANSYVNYPGHKNNRDVKALLEFLRSGISNEIRFQQLTQAGYYGK